MANEQNLIPLGSGKRSEKEEREMRSRGGKKSGETRRKKTAMKKVANLLLNMPVSEEAYPTIINTLQKMGFEDDMITNQTAMLVSMWREAMDGNVRAAEFMRDTAGQKQENIQAQKEFEYKKERDAGISQEIEDLDDIEEEIYGKAKDVGFQHNTSFGTVPLNLDIQIRQFSLQLIVNEVRHRTTSYTQFKLRKHKPCHFFCNGCWYIRA